MKDLKNLYITLFIIILCGVILITNGFGIPFIRGFIGDVLSVVLVVYFLRIFSVEKRVSIVLGFLFAVFLEILQYFSVFDGVYLLSILAGNTFDPYDFLAYGLGAVFVYSVDYIENKY